MTVHVTIELTEDQKARLEQLAAFENVSLPEYILQLAEANARRDAEFRALVQTGIDEADRRELHDHEDVMAEASAHRPRWRGSRNA